MKGFKKKFLSLLLCTGITLVSTGLAYADGTFTDLQKLINDNTTGTITLTQNYTYDYSTEFCGNTGRWGCDLKKHNAERWRAHAGCTGLRKSVQNYRGHRFSKVALENMIITKGGADSTASGGGVYIDAANNVDFSNCTITKCGTEKGIHTSDGGAAIFINQRSAR